MIALPGLNLSAQPAEPLTLPTASSTRYQDLTANTEYRFEVSFTRQLTVKLVTGTAEHFGTELAPATTYTFQGTKGAIFTWHGCKLELSGEAESEYVAEETQAMSALNAHFALESLRSRALQTREAGPRVLVVGPDNAGKTSLVKTLTAYAVKSGRQPMVVNLDPREGMLSVPGSFTAAAFSSIVDIEEGWGSSPISGPSPIPVKMPLVYHYGLRDADEGKVFRPLVTRMALAVTSRLEEDQASKSAGFVVDTPGGLSQGRAGVYENIEHIISEFSVSVVFVLGSERLYSDLSRKYTPRTSSSPDTATATHTDAVHVVRLDKSGGCVDRSESFMKALRHAQIRAYFFGHGDAALAPHSQAAGFDELSLWRVVEDTGMSFTTATLPHESPYSYHDPSSISTASPTNETIFERVTPTADLTNKLLAITTAGAQESHAGIRDASIRGYMYVAEVDEGKRRVKLLSPQPGGVPGGAVVVGRWPEDVPSLVG